MKKIAAIIFIIMLAVQAQAQYVAQDPTRYIPNGRVLGLGKAYVGLADDTGSIYTNPAGLATLKGWQLSSMSGKFLDEYSFLSFSGVYPTDYGVLGFGFAGTSISGAFATTVEAGSDPLDPIYTIDPTQPQMGNYNNAFVLTYANKMSKVEYLKKIPQAENLTFGVSAKIYKTALYGDGIVGGDGSGFDMDLGVKYFPPQKWMTFGAAIQNLLPFGFGGKLTYASGHEESYPSVIEIGSAFKILGKENAFKEMGENELKLMVDLDYHPTSGNYPMIMHTGVEWKPLSYAAIRAGIDQDAAGDGNGGLTTVSDMAYGVGLNFSGFSFDYAYHTFAGAPNVDNNFFSLSYSYAPALEIKEKVVIDEPKDKLITFDDTVKMSGNVMDPEIRDLKAGKRTLRFGLKGDFQSVIELNEGKNRTDIKAMDRNGKLLQAMSLRALRLIKFPDVAVGYWVDKPISLLAMGRVITGYPDGTFRPEGNITRAEMCSLLMKTVDQLSTGEGTRASEEAGGNFQDVKTTHWAASFIAKAAKLGVVKGYPDGSFKPSGNITRAEGLAMVARFAGISEEAYNNEFNDVRASNWAATIIAGATKAGILKFLEGKPFEANNKLNRAETVEMLYRTTTVNTLLGKDLLNWENY